MARTVSFRGAAAVPALGNSSTAADIVLLTIENGASSSTNVEVQEVRMTGVFTNQLPREPMFLQTTGVMPSAGTTLTKNPIQPGSSDANVVVRSAWSDTDTVTAITTSSPDPRLWFGARSAWVNTSFQHGHRGGNQELILLRRAIVLKPGEALIITKSIDWITPLATAGSKHAVSIAWEEFVETAAAVALPELVMAPPIPT